MDPVAAVAAAQTPAQPAAQPNAPEAPGGAAAAEADYETFLRLLTTQIRNQDPLEPLESTQFVAQLASFSAVEQQIQTNEKLDSMLALLGGDRGQSLASWIGKDVRAPGAAAWFDGAPIEVVARPMEGADAARLVARSATGEVVSAQSVDPAAEVVTWRGATELGVAPAGFFSFSIESFREGAFVEARDGEVFAAVEEARDENGEVILVLSGDARIAAEEVGAVRARAAPA